MLTTSRGIKYPATTDPPDLNYLGAQTADSVQNTALLHTAGTPRRVHVAAGLTGTTDASGYATFNHGAPFTPSFVQCLIVKNAVSLGYVISCEASGAAQAIARFGAWNATTTLNSAGLGTAAIVLICWE